MSSLPSRVPPTAAEAAAGNESPNLGVGPSASGAAAAAAALAALEHVLVNVCKFHESSSAVLRDFRRGGIMSVDDLCNLADEQVSALVYSGSCRRDGGGGDAGTAAAGAGAAAAEAAAAPATRSAQEIEIRNIQLLKLWRGHWYREHSAKPTSEDWLGLTKDGLDEFYLGTALRGPPSEASGAGAAAAPAAGRISPAKRSAAETVRTDRSSSRAKRTAPEAAGATGAAAGIVAAVESTIPPGSFADRVEASQSAQDFVKSIVEREPELIPESDAMLLMREVVMLERGVALDVVIRKVTRPFWQACINAVDPPQSDGGRVVAPNQQLRVCAVGTPGIGKTTCTPYLIKMLLEKKKTVVYRVRSEDKDEWIYEFVPGPDGRVTANVYPELAFKSGIQSLKDPSTFYVVDPGDTTDTCNPSPRFRPKVIIVASPDSKHWGANQFTKKRAGLKGVIKVYPVWELDELLIARPYLGSAMTDDQVQDRYRHVGGVPRHVFDDDDASYNDIISQQSLAANKLNGEQAQLLGTVKLQSLTTFDKKQPESSLIGFRVPSDAEFSKYTIDFIAPRVGMSLYRRFMKEMWDKLLLPRAGNPWIFEAYTRYLLGTNRTSTFQRRGGVGKRDFQRGKVQSVSLGGCGEIRSTWDIVAAAKERPMVLFHPIKPTENLIDFIYQDSTQHFHAFQVTLSEKHSAPADDIRKLEQSVGNPRALSLYYLVPEFRFASFVTDPVDPRNPGRGKARATCNIYHVAIPDPNSVKDYEPI